MIYCKVCGKPLADSAECCDECGTPVNGAEKGQNNADFSASKNRFDTAGGYYQDNRNRPCPDYYENGQEPVYEKQSGARKGFAIASLVLGIVGLIATCCSLATYGALSILFGIMGLIFGILGLKSQGKGMAIAGIVMACLNLIIGILLLVMMLVSTNMINNMSPDEYADFIKELEDFYGVDMIRLRGRIG